MLSHRTDAIVFVLVVIEVFRAERIRYILRTVLYMEAVVFHWESLPQSIQDIIESNFDISTTTLPADRLKKPGGLYEKKLADDYEVLVCDDCRLLNFLLFLSFFFSYLN